MPDLELKGEKVIDDRKLLNLLRKRQDIRNRRAVIGEEFTEVDDQAKARITELEVDGKARCGPFVITIERRPARAVSFETKASKRIRITAPKEEE